MMKRKVALLMTTVMLATSVFPSGITAYAEDAVLTGETASEVTLDGTAEEPADVSSVDDDVDIPGETAGTEADSAQAEEAVQEADDEQQPDELVAEEIGADETAQDASAEESDGFAIDDIEVVDEVDSLSAAEEPNVTIAEVTFAESSKTEFELMPSAYDNWQSIIDNMCAIAKFSDDSEAKIENWSYYDNARYYAQTKGGEVYISLWDESGELCYPYVNLVYDRLTLVISDSAIYDLSEDQHIYARQTITIKEPEYEGSFTPGIPLSYSVPANGQKWYEFEALEAKDYILENKIDDSNIFISPAIIVFELYKNELHQVGYGSGNETYRLHFTAEEGARYIMQISCGWSPEDTEVSGTLSEVPPRTVASVKFDESSLTCRVTDFETKAMSVSVTITYDDGETEQFTTWNYEDTSDGEAYSFVGKTEEGKELSLTFWDGGQQINIPVLGGPSVPIGALTMKVTMDDKQDSIPVTITMNDLEALPTEVEIPEYSYGTDYKSFSIPAGSVDRRLKISLAEENAQSWLAYLYQKESSRITRSDRVYSWKDRTLDIIAGQDYVLFLPLQNNSESPLSMKFVMENKKTIQSVTLIPESQYNTFTLQEQLSDLKATVKYDSGEETIEGGWDWTWDDDEENNIMSYETDNGDVITLSFWDGENQIDPVYYYDLFIGKLTIKVAVNGKDIGSVATVSIGITNTEELPEEVTLSPGETQGFIISPRTEDCILKAELGELSDAASVNATLYLMGSDGTPDLEEGKFLSAEKNEMAFEIKAGSKYLLVLKDSAWTGAKVSFAFEQKKSVQSLALPVDVSDRIYSTFEAEEQLRKLPVTITYSDGSLDSIEKWDADYYYDEEADEEYDCLLIETTNKDTVMLVLQKDGKPINIPYISGYRFPVGTFDVKAYVNGVELPVSNDTIELTAPTTNSVSSEAEGTTYSFKGMETLCFYISPQDTAKFLHISCKEYDAEMGLYWKEEDTGDLIRVESGIQFVADGEDVYYRLDADTEYWLDLRDDSACSSGTIMLEDQKNISSISIQGVNGSYDIAEIDNVLKNAQVSVTYEGEDPEEVSLYLGDETEEGVYSYGKTKYSEIVTVSVRKEDSKSTVDIDNYNNILLPGNYTLIPSINGITDENWETSFTLTYSETPIPTLALNKDYPVTLAEGKVKLFRFDPSESGYYIFSSATAGSVDKNSIAMLYDSAGDKIEYSMNGEWGEDFALKYELDKDQVYYYCVSGYELEAVSTTVRLAKVPGIKSITMEAEPTNTTYILDRWDEAYIDYSGMKTRIYYTDGSNEVVDGKDYDKYDNYVHTEIYPLDKSGKPDMNQESYDDSYVYEPGSYALFSVVNYWNGTDTVTVRSSTWVKIVVAEYGHVHKKETTQRIEKSPTCTTAGRKATYCSTCGGRLSGTAAVIPATGHKWGQWTVATAGKAVLTRTCTVCHTPQTQSFTPVLTLTANKLTMKTKQSTAKFKVTAMTAGDSLASVTSNNTKLLKVSDVNPNGTFKLKAQNKTGTAKLTITLKSGASKTIKVKIQKAKVKTTKVKVASKKLALSKKQKYDLAPVVTPVTSYDKLKCTTSNKKVATVSKKGVVTAKAKGKATITITSGKKKVKVNLTVK